jgi:hypothetical protein
MDRLRRALTTRAEEERLKKRDEMIRGKRSRSCEYVTKVVSLPNRNYSLDDFYEICDIIMNFDFYSLCSKNKAVTGRDEEWYLVQNIQNRVFDLFMYLLFEFQNKTGDDKYRFAPIKQVILDFYDVDIDMLSRMESFLDLFENCYEIIEEAIKETFPDTDKIISETTYPQPLDPIKLEFYRNNGNSTSAKNMWNLIMYMYRTKYLRYPTEEPAAHLPSRRRNYIPKPTDKEDVLFNSVVAQSYYGYPTSRGGYGGRKSKKRGYKKRGYKKRSYKKRSCKK